MMLQRDKYDPWETCTWQGARDDVLRRGARMTFREKLVWLDQAARLSRALGSSTASHQVREARPEDAYG